jgi:hypothetical protein
VSVLYASTSDLEAYLQQTVDSTTATLVLQVTSALFTTRAATAFLPTTTTYQVEGHGWSRIRLPYRPIISIQAVRIVTATGVTTTVTDYTRIKQTLYRLAGWGVRCAFPPDMVEVDLTHGFAAVPDDVKGAVLESAAAAYSSPDITVKSESIDDYSVSSAANTGGVMLSPAAETLAELYRGTFAA